MNRVVVSGYYGFGNSGDEAILKTIIRDLRELNPAVQITVLSVKPELTKKQHKVDAVYRYNMIQVLSCLRTCDLFISGGGSLLQDMTSTRSLLYYLYLIRIALMFKKKVMLYANGIGPINNSSNQNKVKKVIQNVDVITLREEASFQLLKDIGITKPMLRVTADPVITIDFTAADKAVEYLKKEGIPTEESLVGINLRDWNGIETLESEMAQTIDYMQEKYSLVPVFIPMSAADKNISERILQQIKGTGYILQQNYQPEDLIGIISNMKLVIAMRLHTLIYASINSVPMIGLVYDPKIKGYMEYINQTCTGDVGTVKASYINTMVDEIISDYDARKGELQMTIEELKDKAKQNPQIAVELLKK